MIETSILIFVVAIALFLAFLIWHMHNKGLIIKSDDEDSHTNVVDKNIECCGEHDVCEAETLLTLADEIIYFSDEELDAYRGRDVDSYSDAEIEEFREVLLTLQQHEVSGWLKSLGLRHIALPAPVREEALMIVDDFRIARRNNRNTNNQK
ncbi:MAG: phospholipase [Marinilabiliaceae bacterium]|nr:phospholipase [Marinilabiliaceae bacterium]